METKDPVGFLGISVKSIDWSKITIKLISLLFRMSAQYTTPTIQRTEGKIVADKVIDIFSAS